MAAFWRRGKIKAEREKLEEEHKKVVQMVEGLNRKVTDLREELQEVEKPLHDLVMGRIPMTDSQIMSLDEIKKLEIDHDAADDYKEKRVQELENRRDFLKEEIDGPVAKMKQLQNKMHEIEDQIRGLG